MKTLIAALFALVASAAFSFAGSPDFNRSLYVCSAIYSDGMPTYEHCNEVSDEEKLEIIETSLYDFEGGEGEAGDSDDDDGGDSK